MCNAFKPLLFLCLFFWVSITQAQIELSDTIIDIPPYSEAYGVVSAINLFDGLHKMHEANNTPSYLALFPVFIPLDRPIDLSDGEGDNGYLLEGSINQLFPIAKGRMHNTRFWQTSSVYLSFAPTVRLTLDNDSKPTVPLTNRLGLRYDKGIWDNISHRKGILKNEIDTLKWTPYEYDPRISIQSLTVSGEIAHYSNGQRSGSLIDTIGEVPNVIRNDYSIGDFSTNYFKGDVLYSYYRDKRLFSASIGYRRDFGVKGIADFTEDQGKRYGRNRLNGSFQIRFKPFLVMKRHFFWYSKKDQKMILLDRLVEHRVRLEFEQILDKKSNLNRYDRENLYKLSMHLYYEVNPLKWRSASLFAHLFYGRDYLNIRYDDPVIGVMGGISLTFKKYIPPFMSKDDFFTPLSTDD